MSTVVETSPHLGLFLVSNGGDGGTRTPDLLTASQALYQLSYAPLRERDTLPAWTRMASQRWYSRTLIPPARQEPDAYQRLQEWGRRCLDS